MTHNPKIKVLLSAYACEPDKGSEPGVGWNWAKQIARFAEVWVITRANNRKSIEKELDKNPVPNLYFIYYDVPKWISFWKKKTRGLYLYYLLWQIGTYKIAKKLHRKERFDLVHYITFGNLWLPTFVPYLPIPFIWGPIGGGEQVPKPFRKEYSFKARIFESIRDVIVLTLKINPLFLYSCKKASLIIARTNETLNKIPNPYRFKTLKMIETGVDEMEMQSITRSDKSGMQIVSVGRLIHWKGFDLAINAFAAASKENANMKLVIVGDGPERERLQGVCKKEAVNDKIIFAGHVNHDVAMKYMSESSVFLFPSLKEGGAWVLFEAMLLGLPIICLDIAGSAEIVNCDCGIKIKPITPQQTINDLADAILKLADNPDLRKKMGEAGRKRVEEVYIWDKKGEFIRESYFEVLNKNKEI